MIFPSTLLETSCSEHPQQARKERGIKGLPVQDLSKPNFTPGGTINEEEITNIYHTTAHPHHPLYLKASFSIYTHNQLNVSMMVIFLVNFMCNSFYLLLYMQVFRYWLQLLQVLNVEDLQVKIFNIYFLIVASPRHVGGNSLILFSGRPVVVSRRMLSRFCEILSWRLKLTYLGQCSEDFADWNLVRKEPKSSSRKILIVD